MLPWVLIDSALTPEGKEIKCFRHDKDYSFKMGSLELMNSRMHGSEDALAELACGEIKQFAKPKILIGGLGMGFTLRAALDQLPADAEVEIAEIMPSVVKWNREILGELTSHPLLDPRVRLHETDVAKLIKSARHQYDAILMDVDNGPQGLSLKGNAGLYNIKGIHSAYKALKPGGIWAIWSSGPDPVFSRHLHNINFEVEEVRVRARAVQKGAHYFIWLARRD